MDGERGDAARLDHPRELQRRGGVVEQAFDPLFSDSSLVTVRYPVPLELPAEPSQGVLRVVDDCPGLLVGDVLRACSAISSTIVYGNAMFPLDGANTKWRRTLAPCDMQPFEQVMEQITSNEGTVLLVLEREI